MAVFLGWSALETKVSVTEVAQLLQLRAYISCQDNKCIHLIGQTLADYFISEWFDGSKSNGLRLPLVAVVTGHATQFRMYHEEEERLTRSKEDLHTLQYIIKDMMICL